MKSVIHPGAEFVTPYSQGRLDALCGLYALINGIRVVHAVDEPLSGQACRSLFRAGLKTLIANKHTGAVFSDGMSAAAQRKLLRSLMSHPVLDMRRPLRLIDQRPKLKTESELDLFVRTAIRRGAVLLVCLDGRMSHHTVITGVSGQKVMLADSCGMTFVFASSLLRPVTMRSRLGIRNIAQLSC